jgi:drug/metabolite transporter (DMT)-like permease
MTHLTWGIASGLGTGLIWAAISVLVRSLSGTLPPIGITTVRSTIGGAILLGVAVASGQGAELAQAPLWAVLSLWVSILFAMGVGDTCFFASMDSLGVTRALVLTMANPLLTTVVGVGFLGEPLTLVDTAGILLVVGGLTLIIAGKGEGTAERYGSRRRGVKLVFLASGAWALSAIIMKAPLEALSAIAATALRFPVPGVVLWFTPWTRGTLRAVAASSPAERMRLGAICLLSSLGSLLFSSGIKYAGVAIGNVLAATAPLFALPFEVLVLQQRPSYQTVFGALITVAGIALMNL